MSSRSVLLIRHGQTAWNQEGRWQGNEPVPLNDEGRRQAGMLAVTLRERPISALISSDLPRAWETAITVGQALGLSPRPDPRWREFHLGMFQGYTREELQSRFPEEWQMFRESHWDFVVPGGESRRALQNRVFDAWREIESGETGTVAVVTHGGSIKVLLERLFDGDPILSELRLPNTSVTTLEKADSGWRLIEAASVAHLNGE